MLEVRFVRGVFAFLWNGDLDDEFSCMVDYTRRYMVSILPDSTLSLEGHRLEMDEKGKLSIQGVVYNEMKGNYSSFQPIAFSDLISAMFPDSYPAFDSGGDPLHIPELTYQEFLDFHQKFYSPDNCLLFLYGDIPTDQHLDFIDDRFISRLIKKYDCRQGGAISDIDTASKKPVIKAEIRKLQKLNFLQESTSIKTYAPETGSTGSLVTLNWYSGIADMEKYFLSEALCGNDSSPLARALKDSELGDDVQFQSFGQFKEEFYTAGLWGVKKGDEAKASGAIQRICEEDPALHFDQNHETHEMIISGLGEQHLDVAVSKMKAKFGVEVTLAIPKVAYRETITKSVQVQGKHKKQSGGSGQYGDVWVEFQPFEGDFEFAERVVGGSVPKQYFPAVEKGLAESMKKGVLAGYPMVGVKATLYDGSYHSVDSNEMAFKTAASLAFKNGIPQAAPVILEPISEVKAYVNDEVMGEIIGDFNKRRGRVLGMNPVDDMQEIVAEVPTAEMGDFATVLRQITQGRGWYTMEFVRYERAIPAVAEKVIAAAKEE